MSAARCGSPCRDRTSTAAVRPSIQPRSRNSCTKARTGAKVGRIRSRYLCRSRSNQDKGDQRKALRFLSRHWQWRDNRASKHGHKLATLHGLPLRLRTHATTSLKQEAMLCITANSAANVRVGSFTSDLGTAMLRAMSAIPPTAPKSLRRNEPPLGARSGLMHRGNTCLFDHLVGALL
jgi:hypothetical protein